MTTGQAFLIGLVVGPAAPKGVLGNRRTTMKRTLFGFLVGFSVASLVVVAAAQSQRVPAQRASGIAQRPPQAGGSTVGRYQVIPTGENFYSLILLDSTTGDTWTNCLDPGDEPTPAVPAPDAEIEKYLDGLIAADEAALGRRYSDTARIARRETLRELRKQEIEAMGTPAKPGFYRKSWCIMPQLSNIGIVSRTAPQSK